MALSPEVIVCPRKPLVSGFYGYLLEKIIKMRFNRIFADEQRTSDLVIRRADTQLIQDLFFPDE